jgi:hypothetical protein
LSWKRLSWGFPELLKLRIKKRKINWSHNLITNDEASIRTLIRKKRRLDRLKPVGILQNYSWSGLFNKLFLGMFLLPLYCLLLTALRAFPVENTSSTDCPKKKSETESAENESKKCTIFRYDSNSVVSQADMVRVEACTNETDDLLENLNQNYLKSNLVTTNPNPFSIDFTCEAGVDATKCRQAQAGFISAGNRIAQILAFPQTVKVKATFKSFCNGNRTGCALADTLGQASPAAYFSARPVSERKAWYFYPVLQH